MRFKRLTAIIACVSLIASCSKPGESENTTTVSSTVTETTGSTSVITESSSPEISAAPVDIYSAYMDKIDELEAAAPGMNTYSISAWYDPDKETNYYVLTVFNGDTQVSYQLYDSEWGPNADQTIVYPEEDAFSYEEIRRIPYLSSTEWMNHNGVHAEFTDMVDDGVYFGRLIGISEDASYAFIMLGAPSDLYTGEVISLNDLDEEECDFLAAEEWGLDDPVMVTIPIAPHCVVTDDYPDYIFLDGYDTRDTTGDPMIDSYFYYYLEQTGYFIPANNGWISAYSRCAPVVVSGGQITSICLRHPVNGHW